MGEGLEFGDFAVSVWKAEAPRLGQGGVDATSRKMLRSHL